MLARTDHHLTRVALDVDEEGWHELVQAYMDLYERVFQIQATAAGRMADDVEPVRVISFSPSSRCHVRI